MKAGARGESPLAAISFFCGGSAIGWTTTLDGRGRGVLWFRLRLRNIASRRPANFSRNRQRVAGNRLFVRRFDAQRHEMRVRIGPGHGFVFRFKESIDDDSATFTRGSPERRAALRLMTSRPVSTATQVASGKITLLP